MSATASGARLLLDASVDRAAIDASAEALGWSLVNVFGRRPDRPRQVVFATAEGALVAFVEDHRIAARYLVFTGHDVDGPLDAARRRLPHRTLDDVRAAFAEDRVRGLCWLAVAGPSEPDDEWDAAIQAAASDADPRVRDAARFASEALGWPERAR